MSSGYCFRLVAGILPILILLGCSQGGKTVAVVNQTKISLSDFEHQFKDLQSMRPGQMNDEASKKQLLEQMVKQEILAQAAIQLGLDQKPETKQKIAAESKQFKEQLEASLERDKYHLARLDHDVKNNVLIQTLLEEKQKEGKLSDKEVKNYYDNLVKQNGGQRVPSYQEVSERLRQQLLIDQLVAEYKEKANVEEHLELLANTAGGNNSLSASQQVPLPSKP